MRRLLAVVLAVVAALFGFARLAPSDPDRWHVAIGAGPAEEVGLGRYVIRRPAVKDDLQRLDAIALSTPRTTRLAGAPAEGRVTWITRSRVFGFPDYTTAEQAEGELRIHARLRFGSSDLGVNRARVRGWLAALDADVTPEDG